MKKDDITALGISEQLAEKVIALYNSSIDGSFIPKSRFNEVNEENKTLKQSVADRDKQLETLKAFAGDNEDLKKQIADLQKQNADQKKAHDAEMSQLRLDNAVDTALTLVNAKNSRSLKKFLDMSKIKLDEEGKLTGFDEQVKAIRESDGYMFNEKQQPVQQFRGFQPGASGDVKPNAKVDMSKMTYEELTSYIENNPDVV